MTLIADLTDVKKTIAAHRHSSWATCAECAAAVDHVREFMRKHGLTPNDLIAIGGEDFRSRRLGDRARRVERCWAFMARLGVGYLDVETSFSTAFQNSRGITRH